VSRRWRLPHLLGDPAEVAAEACGHRVGRVAAALLPLATDATVAELARYVHEGGALVSVNVGYALHSAAQVRELVAGLVDAVERCNFDRDTFRASHFTPAFRPH
jgi:hypothetical protein